MPAQEPVAVTDGIWYVEARLNGVWATIYIVKGDRLAVVDTGYNFHPETVIVPALERLGFSLEQVELILNTHGHPDHLGGNAALSRLTGAHICLHKDDLQLADGPDAHVNSATDHITAMIRLGWSDEVEARKQFLHERVDACEVSRVLEEGDAIDLGSGMDIRVIHTPGHSQGSVTFHIGARDIAFTGDAVQGWGTQKGILPLYYDPLAYEKSLEKIAQLNPTTLCLGHNVRWSEPAADSSPIRSGHEVRRTLQDSQQILAELNAKSAAVPESISLADKVASVSEGLRDPFEVPLDHQGRLPASSAATIISHLKTTGPR